MTSLSEIPSIPKTFTAFRRLPGKNPGAIQSSIETTPDSLEPSEVLLKIRAVSLNFRDVGMLHDRYPVTVKEQGIAASDCAAEVIAIGSGVSGFGKGDRVSVIFSLGNLAGDEDEHCPALGGDVEGVLREYAVFDQENLVHLPKHLSWEEASTLTCAGVTAWSALNASSSGPKGRSALLSGTGGVSIFALLLCVAAGITPIITSSSNDKLTATKKLSDRIEILGINYKETPKIEEEVMRLTDGKGVDVVVNNIGLQSLPSDIESLRARNGVISMVGFLGGFDAEWPRSVLMGLMNKLAWLRGIGVGSKKDYEDLNRFLEEKKVSLTPIVDRVFPFEQSNDACEYLYSGQHSGKVVIRVS